MFRNKDSLLCEEFIYRELEWRLIFMFCERESIEGGNIVINNLKGPCEVV